MSDGRPGGQQVRAEGREAGRPSSAPTALGVAGSLLTQGSLFELNGLRSGGHTRYSRSSRHWSPEDREHFRRHGTMTGNAVSARKEVRFPRTRAETALRGEWRPDRWSAAQQSSRPPAGTGSVPGGREPTWHRLFRVASPRLELVGVTDRGAERSRVGKGSWRRDRSCAEALRPVGACAHHGSQARSSPQPGSHVGVASEFRGSAFKEQRPSPLFQVKTNRPGVKGS